MRVVKLVGISPCHPDGGKQHLSLPQDWAVRGITGSDHPLTVAIEADWEAVSDEKPEELATFYVVRVGQAVPSRAIRHLASSADLQYHLYDDGPSMRSILGG